MKPPVLRSLRIRNFKAFRDTGALKITPLTALIGDNGVGKSGVIESLETLQTLVLHDLDAAMQLWRGMEHICCKRTFHDARSENRRLVAGPSPIEFSLRGCGPARGDRPFSATTVLNSREHYNEIFFEREEVKQGAKKLLERNSDSSGLLQGSPARFNPRRSGLAEYLAEFVERWQILRLAPSEMGEPWPQSRTGGAMRLSKNGSNIAEYLLDIRERDLAAFAGIVETLRLVLPYASDVQPTLTSELDRRVYLQLSEADFKVPGWLVSTGTMRILALIAVLRHPNPPWVIAIEEIENGLDPRTIHLLVDEIQSAVESGRTQVILTTHSPYLLDLLPLSSVVLVERIDGEPKFTRPAENAEVRQWAKRFAPGQLYTAERLRVPRNQKPRSA